MHQEMLKKDTMITNLQTECLELTQTMEHYIEENDELIAQCEAI